MRELHLVAALARVGKFTPPPYLPEEAVRQIARVQRRRHLRAEIIALRHRRDRSTREATAHHESSAFCRSAATSSFGTTSRSAKTPFSLERVPR